MKNAIKLGLIMAAVSIVSSVIITTLIDAETIFSATYLWSSMGISLIILIILGRYMLRPKDYQGLSYGEALKYLFVSCLVYYSIAQIATIALYNNNAKIEEAYYNYVYETQLSGLEMGMRFAGAEDIEIENEIEEMKEKIDSGEIPLPDYPYTWASLPMNFLISIIFSLIYALIAAIFVKKQG